jgi:hypothetical protein
MGHRFIGNNKMYMEKYLIVLMEMILKKKSFKMDMFNYPKMHINISQNKLSTTLIN